MGVGAQEVVVVVAVVKLVGASLFEGRELAREVELSNLHGEEEEPVGGPGGAAELQGLHVEFKRHSNTLGHANNNRRAMENGRTMIPDPAAQVHQLCPLLMPCWNLESLPTGHGDLQIPTSGTILHSRSTCDVTSPHLISSCVLLALRSFSTYIMFTHFCFILSA